MNERGYLHLFANQLHDAGISPALREARLLIQSVLGCSYVDLLHDPLPCLTSAQYTVIQERVTLRCQHKPLSKILGQKEFWSHTFRTSTDVLDPRPDSESLIESALEHFPDKNGSYRFLELGVGSGCLLLTLLKEYPNATGVGVDISEEALKIAAYNAHALEVDHRVTFQNTSWLVDVDGTYDLLVSNPPYISASDYDVLPTVVKKYDPKGALTPGQEGLEAYREIASQLAKRLKDFPVVLLEIGTGQLQDVQKIFGNIGYDLVRARIDLRGIPRALTLKPQ